MAQHSQCSVLLVRAPGIGDSFRWTNGGAVVGTTLTRTRFDTMVAVVKLNRGAVG